MKTKIIKLCFLTVMVSLLTSCVNDTYENPEQEECINPGLTKTKEVADIYDLATGTTTTYNADDIIEAVVISSDEGGNFYKSMYLEPLDGSKGFNVSIDEVNLYTKKFQVGRKVFLKMKKLAFANPALNAKGLIFGAPPTESYAVDRISALSYKNYLIPSCDVVNEEDIVKHLSLSQVSSSTHLNTLVEIDDVQFKTDCATYSKPDFDTSLKITDGTNTLNVKTSRFANFAGYKVPSGRGKIRGVLTKYGTTYQLILRTQRDVKFTNPRVITVYPPKKGASLQYSGAFTENFESYAVTTTGADFPKYINDVAIGFKYWDVKLYRSNKYLQASAYNNGCTKTYFIVPVDMTTANSFSFKTKDGNNNGNPLKVYYSMDYIPGGNVSQATLVEITNKFIISSGHTSGYGTSFISSGAYPIPATLTGNGYFIFEYDGTNGASTTIQIDDIKVN